MSFNVFTSFSGLVLNNTQPSWLRCLAQPSDGSPGLTALEGRPHYQLTNVCTDCLSLWFLTQRLALFLELVLAGLTGFSLAALARQEQLCNLTLLTQCINCFASQETGTSSQWYTIILQASWFRIQFTTGKQEHHAFMTRILLWHTASSTKGACTLTQNYRVIYVDETGMHQP